MFSKTDLWPVVNGRAVVAERGQLGKQCVSNTDQIDYVGIRGPKFANESKEGDSIIGATTASKPLSVVVRSEDCARTPEGLKCAGTAATVLTLLPADQSNSFVIRTVLDELLGAVRLRLASISMICVPRTEQWLRSYAIETAAVKRCPAAGSCNSEYCSSVRSGIKVPELVELNHRPGHSMCMRSSSFWQNACALPSAACLFYRWAAVPTTTTVFEEFGCLEWDLQINAWIELETNDGKLETKELTLHPGVPEEWGNMTISVLPASLPPLPALAAHFLTDGRAMAMVKPIPSDLHCSDEDQARGFDNCKLAIDSCRKCTPNHDNGSIHCHCRDLDLERVMDHPEQRLPLDVARLHLHHRGPEVRAEFQYTPVQVRVQLHGVELLSEYSNTRCWVTSPKLSGCYRCTAGAVFEAKCQTDHGTALAKVKCADGTLFALHCGDNGTTTAESIPFDRAEVFTECRVKCPAGATTFRLQGELAFLPKQQQFGFGQRESRGGRLEQGGGFSFGGHLIWDASRAQDGCSHSANAPTSRNSTNSSTQFPLVEGKENCSKNASTGCCSSE
uniref:Phlebovirus glycoprotein G2 fusion domain-containing protein n=1 Tax=Globodera rostochiensis TaxID=31243 RepID=A0A914H5B8_GLORO